jgi:hypothetical protein
MTEVRKVIEGVYIPRDHALEFHARWQRYAVLVWHRRAGKTVMCVNDLIDKAMQNTLDMPRYGYVAPLYRQAKDIAWAYLKFYAAGMIDKIMESELAVILNGNGARIQLHGADNPDSLRGVYWDGIILDEYGDMRPKLFNEVILPSLIDREGWCAFIGTAKGPNHFQKLWKEALKDLEWYTFMLKASESGLISDEAMRAIENMPGADEDTIAQEFECDFEAAVKGAYYGKLLKKCKAEGLHGHFPYDPDRLVLTAWDIGYTDDTSIWFFQTDGKVFRIIDFFTVSGYSVDDVMGVLAEKDYAYGIGYLPHDAKNKSFQTGKSTRELIHAAGMKTRIVPSLSVQDGIQAVRKTLPMMQFNTDNPDVEEGMEALKLYQREFDDKNQRFREEPLHNWCSNPADAMRMLALAMNPAAAKKESRKLQTEKPQTPVGNVYSLEKLYAERAARTADPRRI